MRLRLDLAYDGSGFHGWARQPGLRTVQGDLEQALATVLRVESVEVTVAGRTDVGVHARGQVAHLDVDAAALAAVVGRSADAPVDALLRRVGGVLAADVHVRAVALAPVGFDARFSAVWRRYAYRVADRVTLVDPLVRGHVLTWARPLDLDAMNEASARLLGEHDFAAFCRKREGATTIRTLLELTWSRHEHGPERGAVEATVRADAFCHSMVRALVGCLLAVGDGRRPPEWAAEVLAGRRRDPAVTVARAHGLTLEEVRYPPDAELAARAQQSRALRTLPPGPSGSPG